jgi:LPXTG-motif cell wall-anchored protein
VETEGGTSQTQLFIAIGVVVLLILLAVFVVSRITGG